LRLRAEEIAVPDERNKILTTISEMDEMIGTTLAFARDEVSAEPRRRVDLSALLSSAVDDMATARVKRLGRIEGQVRGIARMVGEDRYFIDIVTQILAVRAALRRVQDEILRDHVAHCVSQAVALRQG
jgi:DNA-binding FrmR family transcriptional regulator